MINYLINLKINYLMNLKINPIHGLSGEIIAPPSKSYSHRAFIAASLADGVSVIKNPLTSGDVEVTIDILKELKVNILKKSENSYVVEKDKRSFKSINKALNCKNSGTSFRIFSALGLLVEGGLVLTGEFLKRNRPILPLLDALKSLGGDYKISKNEIRVERKQKMCKPIKIRGDVSSQFITALLIVTPLMKCNNVDFIEVEVLSPMVSHPYIGITMDVLKSFGINVQERLAENGNYKYHIYSRQKYRPQVYEVPGDFSSIAFVIAAAVLSDEGSIVKINNVNFEDSQGDKKMIDILLEMGSKIEINQDINQLTVFGKGQKCLNGIEIDCREIPDLFPILSVIGAFAKGRTVLFNALNLRVKESDRISTIARELSKMGVKVEEEEDRLTIYQCDDLKGSNIQHDNDHRMAMACMIAALFAESPSQIENVEIVKDSYSNFINDLQKLGANFEIN